MNELKNFLEQWLATYGQNAPQAVTDKVSELLDLLEALDGIHTPSPVEQLIELELVFLRHPANAARFKRGNPRKDH